VYAGVANIVTALRLGFPLLAAALMLPAQDIKEFEKQVTEFSLPNGLHFILVERHDAPVVAFHTYVNAGAVDDPSGQSGMAHMFEHMAFKGTETIGTRNWVDEKRALDAIEDLYDRLEAEKNRGPGADQSRVGTLQTQLKLAMDRAEYYVQPNEFPGIIEENGGVGLNASTGLDATEYLCSLPSNRIELWFLMESQRFLHPVFRQFYKERDAVVDEYRQQMESRPQGKLIQSLLATAFAAHPYRNPPGGWPSDIANLRRSGAKAFFEKYYVPGNMTMALVGDVNPAEAKRMAERYFGPMPAKPLPSIAHTQEPPQPGPKVTIVDSTTQPMAMIAYKRPSQDDKDDSVFDMLQVILFSGRTGMLYKEMVEDKRISQVAQAGATFPNGRYPNLFVFFLVPSQGHTLDENQKALDDLLARLKARKVDAETLQRARTQAMAAAVRLLGNNSGLAKMMAFHSASYGDWRKMFTSIDDLNKVTADDVQRVAQKYFVPVNRTIAYTGPPNQTRPQPVPAAGGPGKGGRQ
jgi:predicted Zn-dependent peptidase